MSKLSGEKLKKNQMFFFLLLPFDFLFDFSHFNFVFVIVLSLLDKRATFLTRKSWVKIPLWTLFFILYPPTFFIPPTPPPTFYLNFHNNFNSWFTTILTPRPDHPRPLLAFSRYLQFLVYSHPSDPPTFVFILAFSQFTNLHPTSRLCFGV